MRKTAYLLLSVVSIAIISVFVYNYTGKKQYSTKNKISLLGLPEEEGGNKRRLYEWKMLHDPAKGEIPRDIHKKELALLRSIQSNQNAASFRQTINNSYTAAGPSQNGGRTRAVAYDIRNSGVMLAAGISGGIFRSTDGGATWSFSNPINDVRIVSCLAQDPRPGFQDTWYAGTGEFWGSSPTYPNALIPGHGIYKSVNNGQTWTKLPSSIDQNETENGFVDDIFDMVFNIQVDNNGHVYAAVLGAILRSTNGGNTWGGSLFELSGLSTPNTPLVTLITDIAISKPGVAPVRYYASFSGRSIDSDTAGVWTSTNGNFGSWTKIGGPSLVTGWRAYDNTITNNEYNAGWGRTILAVAPSNSNILYVMYDNGLVASSGQAEADLFRANLASFPTVSWANRSANLMALQNGSTTKYLETQDEYNMLLAVHPTLENFVLAGGVNLFKSTDGFLNPGTFIGGLESTTYNDPNRFSHVDFHAFAFHPSTPNRFVVGNDGGLQVTNDITASTITWDNLNSQYQTFQYYHVAIDPTLGSLTFSGGAQDNSTSYRDSKLLFGPALSDPNDHYVGLLGGDGGMTALSPSTSTQQYLYASAQNGILARLNIVKGSNLTGAQIDPSSAPEGEFVTYYHLDPDNTELLYYVADNRLWRTTSATTVTATSGWTEMTGIAAALNTSGESIFALATSRGTYNGTGSYLFIGSDKAKIYRMQDPRNAAASTAPVNITPSGITADALVREIAVNPRNPDTVLAVISNYGATSAFWTGNALSASPTWQLVEGNIATASFRSCAIVATTTGVEYYVGTSIGLFSTSTINSTSTVWTLEGPAVMQGAIVNDLVLRTADNTLLVGTHGNGMFYTVIGNVPTSVPDVVVNDKRFINAVFPTITPGDINFRTGGATGIKTIHIRVTNLSGQVLMKRTQAYQNGTVPLGPLSTGSYLLEIISDNRRYKHVQQFVKTN
ncbi:T9SS type A sorting domain-containing protein [Lacibacter sp.]|uniref:T9SS type A sorting domain-containing protein n=1 Tax=Lacibacter sp. TaxID=1915409 RepID=UPI002B4B06E3|nr:T9SS type A sorting domain-containing protein [Lacibacter sp.]HLP36401.1 T9SS type A sorting domain-containing protein [Lacibacter sp.]